MSRYQPVLDYIENYWQHCLLSAGSNAWGRPRSWPLHLGRIRLPHTGVMPNDEYFAGTQYYWDSYFSLIGLIEGGRVREAREVVDNLVYLFGKFGLVPARNSWTSLGRSQPPFLTRMAWEVYEATGDRDWLDRVMTVAQTEYEQVWTSGQRLDAASRLSKYQPKYFPSFLTVYESGWDISKRFTNKQLRILPVDLNCQLYQYEADLLHWSELKDDRVAMKRWRQALRQRRKLIAEYFWDEKTGFFYDNCDGRPGSLKTLAGFMPLWCGAATKTQAARAVRHLPVFEQPGGLANSEKLHTLHQWDYPNGWPPQQLLTNVALRNYGFTTDADRLASKWLECNRAVFERTGKLWEKYDVVKCRIGRRGRYPTQAGFAWTCGVFLRLVKQSKSARM